MWVANRNYDVHFDCGHVGHYDVSSVWESRPYPGFTARCPRCSNRSIVSRIVGLLEEEDVPTVAETDPQSALGAWVSRMSLRHGPVLWDQVDDREASWEDALWFARHQDQEPFVARLFTPEDLKAAEKWEERKWPRDEISGVIAWPLRFMPMALRDAEMCMVDDHSFKLSKDLDSDSWRIVCTDVCEQPIVRWVKKCQRFIWSPCCSIEDIWENDWDFRNTVEVDIPIRISQTREIEFTNGEDFPYLVTNIEAVFAKEALVCRSCGRQIVGSRKAMSRHLTDENGKHVYVCPGCGQLEAMKDFRSHKMEFDGK